MTADPKDKVRIDMVHAFMGVMDMPPADSREEAARHTAIFMAAFALGTHIAFEVGHASLPDDLSNRLHATVDHIARIAAPFIEQLVDDWEESGWDERNRDLRLN